MRRTVPKVNRGPAAAAENRQALLDAAKKVFAEQGYHAPFSAVAKAAGVGQAVLYRHFPTRLALAFAVFDENWARYEALASDESDSAFLRLWQRFIDDTIESAAFVELAVDARRSLEGYDATRRLKKVFTVPLKRAQAAGLVDASLSVDELLLAQRMAFGVIVTARSASELKRDVRRALALMPRFPA